MSLIGRALARKEREVFLPLVGLSYHLVHDSSPFWSLDSILIEVSAYYFYFFTKGSIILHQYIFP